MKLTPFEKRRQGLGTLYGAVGGFVFAVLTWGVDAISLARAHAGMPFAMFLPGALVCGLFGALLGWICIKIDRTILTVILWVLSAYALVTFMLWLRFTGYQLIMNLLRPDLVGILDYQKPDGYGQYLILSVIVVGILALICGALESLLVESAMSQSGVGGVLLMVLLCGGLMGFAGNIIGGVVNDDIRESTRALDRAIHMAVDADQVGLQSTGKRSVVSDILDLGSEVYNKTHRLTLLKYDPFMFVEIHYLVEFGDTQLDCNTIVKKAIMCKPYIRK